MTEEETVQEVRRFLGYFVTLSPELHTQCDTPTYIEREFIGAIKVSMDGFLQGGEKDYAAVCGNTLALANAAFAIGKMVGASIATEVNNID